MILHILLLSLPFSKLYLQNGSLLTFTCCLPILVVPKAGFELIIWNRLNLRTHVLPSCPTEAVKIKALRMRFAVMIGLLCDNVVLADLNLNLCFYCLCTEFHVHSAYQLPPGVDSINKFSASFLKKSIFQMHQRGRIKIVFRDFLQSKKKLNRKNSNLPRPSSKPCILS